MALKNLTSFFTAPTLSLIKKAVSSFASSRRDRIYQLFLVVTIILLIFIPQACNREKQSEKKGSQEKRAINFAFIYNYPEASGSEVPRLIGAFNSGLRITLLHKTKSQVCITKTGAQKKEHYEDGVDITFTELAELTSCSKPDEYSVAVLGSNIKSYEAIPLQELKNRKAIMALDQKVRATKELHKLLARAGGISYIVEKDIATDLPRVFTFSIESTIVYIVEYDMSWSSYITGPRVMIIDGSIRGLTGQCSYPHVRVFRINKQFYVESGTSCCECGIRGQELFRIDKNGPVLVYKDYSFSD